MNTTGDSVNNPQVVNLKQPLPHVTLHTEKGPLSVDMNEFKAAAERLGLGGIQKGDVLSINSHRNAKGQLVPDYETIRIEREAKQ